MQKIINITNLNTNEISVIGAGFGLSLNNVPIKLAHLEQSVVSEIKNNANFLINTAKTTLSILSPVLGVVVIATKRKYSKELARLNYHFQSLVNIQQ
jgi:hypothetical protein